MRQLLILLVAISCLVAADTSCKFNTSLGFIVDTSESTDSVALTMKAALDEVASVNGAVLAFQDYMLTTWQHPANAIQHFPTIQSLKASFDAQFYPGSWVNNERLNEPQYPAQHDDWAYMLDSLEQQVLAAQPNGFIVVLGDQDEICDGRPHPPLFSGWYAGQYNNDFYDAKIPNIIAIAQAKNVRISFYYFVWNNWAAQVPGSTCPPEPSAPGNREWPVGQVANISSLTGGVALYNESLADEMANEVKMIGKNPAVCDTNCTEDSTLAIIVDTSGEKSRVQGQVLDIFAKLQIALVGGTFKKFNHYLLASWATTVPTVFSYNTFGEMYARVQQDSFYGNNMTANDTNSGQSGNDWLYAINNLQEMVNHVGVGGFMIIISDQEGFCDAGRYNSDPAGVQMWTEALQLVTKVAITKKITFAWYMFDDGSNGNSPESVLQCSVPSVHAGYLNAIDRAGEMAVILSGESRVEIPTKQESSSGYYNIIGDIVTVIVTESQRPSCQNCTNNATIGFSVDTSDSSLPIKDDYKWAFTQIALLAPQLTGFTGGVELNTWEMMKNETMHFANVIALNAYIAGAQLAANRVIFDVPSHNHDDWRYMLENLPLLIMKVNKDGYIFIIADDNQICDAWAFPGHNTSEPLFVQSIVLAKSLNVKISYFQLATVNHYCTHAQMMPGQGLAWTLTNATGGVSYFGMNETDVHNDVTKHLIPDIAYAGSKTVQCPAPCPPGTERAFDICQPINPCDVQPCRNGATCVPTPHTTQYRCVCPPGKFGPLCQFDCVPHSYFNQTNNALGIVLDTSDSTAFSINSMKTVLSNLLLSSLAFDKYFLSTWAYQPPWSPLVKSFPNATAVKDELSLPGAITNKRILNDTGLATHNDWKYMLDSVEAILPQIGQNGVLLVVTDFEGICDAEKSARMVAGVPRYPMNPDLARVAMYQQYAHNHKIKIFFFTFPSSDYGWCNVTQKQTGLGAAQQLVAWTGGLVEDVPGYLSIANTQAVLDSINEVVQEQAQVQRCDCPVPYVLNANTNVCVLPQ